MQRAVWVCLGGLYLLTSLYCTAQRCDTERVESDGRLFRTLSSGEIRSCKEDFVYELRDNCGECRILKIGYAMATPCIADLEITFGGNRVEDARRSTWIRSNNVRTRSGVEGATDGFVGVFDGNSYIEVPLFEYSELGARVEIKIRYRESAKLTGSSVDMGLVSNSGRQGMFPTFAIIHSLGQNAILGALNTTGGAFVQFNIPQPDSVRYDWKTVTFDYNALAEGEDRAMLILEQPNVISRSDVLGNIQALRTPLVIGKGAFFESFQGEIDFIRISRCSPVTRSRIN